MRLRSRSRKFSALLTAFILVLTPLPLSAHCSWIFYIDQDPELRCDNGPVYYTVLDAEPDWCAYTEGSGAYIRLDENATITGWYVVPAYDTTTAPPSGFFTVRAWIYHNPYIGCGFSWF